MSVSVLGLAGVAYGATASAASVRVLSEPEGSVAGEVNRSFADVGYSYFGSPQGPSVVYWVEQQSQIVLDGDRIAINAAHHVEDAFRLDRYDGASDADLPSLPAGLERPQIAADTPKGTSLGDTTVSRALRWGFEIDDSYAFTLSATNYTYDEAALSLVRLVRLADGEDADGLPFRLDRADVADTVVQLLDVEIHGSTAAEVLDGQVTRVYATGSTRRGDVTVAEALAASELLTAFDGETVEGVLPAGQYAIEVFGSASEDYQPNWSTTTLSFAARPLPPGSEQVAHAPTPSALAGGMVGALALLRRRRG